MTIRAGRPRASAGALFAAAVLLCGLAACDRQARGGIPEAAIDYAARPPVRLSMDDLHRAGGVPPGWSLTVPVGDASAGREIFAAQGCPSCHAVEGDGLSADERRPGPELTGMADHHPQAYFVEAILNPNAVIVEGPGYAGADGLSTMPAYPDLTAAELTHLIAYLASLTGDGAEAHAGCENEGPRLDFKADRLPAAGPPAANAAPSSAESEAAQAFLAVTYEVRAGAVDALRAWFSGEGGEALRSFDGLVDVETHVDRTRRGGDVVTVFAFRDMSRLFSFLAEAGPAGLLRGIDTHAEAIDRQIFETRPVYRAGAFSLG